MGKRPFGKWRIWHKWTKSEVKVQCDVSGSLEVANMMETAIKSKIGEGDGRKMTFFVQKMMNLQKFAISQWFGKNLCVALGMLEWLFPNWGSITFSASAALAEHSVSYQRAWQQQQQQQFLLKIGK